MNQRLQSKALFCFLSVIVLTIFSGSSIAQESVPTKPAEGRVPSQPTTPAPDPGSDKLQASKEKLRFSAFSRRLGRVSLTVMEGVQLDVDNRTAGRITVHGWDRDVVEATATSERGNEVIVFAQSEDDGPKRISLKADYADLENADPTASGLELPPLNNDNPIPIHLEVNVPRYAELKLIRVIRSDVQINGIDTAVAIIGHSSNFTLKDVGSVDAHTRTGSIVIENARGISDISSSTGRISVSNSRGAVRAVSIAGPIEIKCVKGRIDVGNTQALIELKGIDGDVDAIASSSDVRLTGPLSEDARYYLKSMSGRVEMIIPEDIRGFNATLTSYRGSVESDFSLVPKPAASETGARHRLAGRFGKGSPQITLDSFQGLVKLTRVPRNSIAACK